MKFNKIHFENRFNYGTVIENPYNGNSNIEKSTFNIIQMIILRMIRNISIKKLPNLFLICFY
jgi:hypothetical protein